MNAEHTEQALLRSRMPELDNIRGMAILLVILFHGFAINYENTHGLRRFFLIAMSTGWVGVDLFFVLSGFLITGILLDTKHRPDFYRRFYFRRALRILPLYYAVLILYALSAATGWLFPSLSIPFLTFCVFYSANLAPLFGIAMQYGVLWSLAVEEHFYLIWPAVVRNLSRRRVAMISIAICALCPMLRALSFVSHGSSGVTTYGTGYTWHVADGLAMGALIAALMRGRFRSRGAGLRIAIGMLGASIVLFCTGAPFGIFRLSTFMGATLRQTALNGLCAALLVGSLLLGTSRGKALMQIPVLGFLGDISYGLYALHILIFSLVDHLLYWIAPGVPISGTNFLVLIMRFLVGFGASIAIAYVSRRYFEDYFLKLKDRSPSAEVREVAPVGGGPALIRFIGGSCASTESH